MSPEESELAARFFDDDLGGMDHALPPLDGYLPSELVGDLDQSGHGGAAPSAIFDETQPPQPTTSLKKRKQDALSGALPEEENPKALKSSGKDESASDDAGASKRQQTATASVPQNQKQRSSCVVAQPPEEVAGFVRTLFTLLRVCDPQIVSWSSDGSAMLIHDPARFAGEVCPKFFRHRNFNSFTRLLNMYQFHKVPTSRRDAKEVCFEHQHFRKGREDLLPLVQRKGAQLMRDELLAREIFERNLLTQQTRQQALVAGWAAAAQQQQQQQPDAAFATTEPSLRQPELQNTSFEPALQPLHQCDPTGWMRRVALLETEVRSLKNENDRLKSLEHEKETLTAQLQAQQDLITALQAQSTFLNNCAPPPPSDSSFSSRSSSSDDEAGVAAPPPAVEAAPEQPQQLPDFNSPEFQALIQSVGGPVGAVAMLFSSVLNAQLPQEDADSSSSRKRPAPLDDLRDDASKQQRVLDEDPASP